jgi:hypothetical protein
MDPSGNLFFLPLAIYRPHQHLVETSMQMNSNKYELAAQQQKCGHEMGLSENVLLTSLFKSSKRVQHLWFLFKYRLINTARDNTLEKRELLDQSRAGKMVDAVYNDLHRAGAGI